MFYDLHIHSALSPCSADDMTPNNIVNMALIAGLDLIAVTDHNSILQLPALQKVCEREKLELLYGIEVQTIEEVHVLCYFKELKQIQQFFSAIEGDRLKLPCNQDFFGQQLIFDEDDQLIGEELDLLLTSIVLPIDEICFLTHQYGGSFVLAHALDRVNSITTQLGFIPQSLEFDGIEIKNNEEKARLIELNPWIKDTVWLMSSDAHQLVDIQDPINSLSKEDYERLWR